MGNFILEYEGSKISLATWNDTVWNKYYEGDKVHIVYNHFVDDPKYGKSGRVLFIEHADTPIGRPLEGESHDTEFSDKEKENLNKQYDEMGLKKVTTEGLKSVPKQIELDVGKKYTLWGHDFIYTPNLLTLVE